MKFSAAAGWFRHENFTDCIRDAAKHGFNAVEKLGWRDLDFDEVKSVLDECGVTNTALVIESRNPANQRAMGTAGIVCREVRGVYVDSFRESIAAAKAMDVPNIIVTTGDERRDISRADQHRNCVDTMREMAKLAEDAGITVILEPLNVLVDHAGYFLSSSQEGFAMVDEVNSPNVKLLFDIYHQQISEGNIIRNIVQNIDKIGHFHIADNPGRNQPGTGEICYANVFSAIRDVGYTRYLAFECGSTVDVDTLCADMHALIGPFQD